MKDDKDDISKDTLQSIWWRRPGRYRLDAFLKDPSVREFCIHE